MNKELLKCGDMFHDSTGDIYRVLAGNKERALVCKFNKSGAEFAIMRGLVPCCSSYGDILHYNWRLASWFGTDGLRSAVESFYRCGIVFNDVGL